MISLLPVLGNTEKFKRKLVFSYHKASYVKQHASPSETQQGCINQDAERSVQDTGLSDQRPRPVRSLRHGPKTIKVRSPSPPPDERGSQ